MMGPAHANYQQRARSSTPQRQYSLPRGQRLQMKKTKGRAIKCMFIDINCALVTNKEEFRLPLNLEQMTPDIAVRILLLKNIILLTGCKLVLTGRLRGNPDFIGLVNYILNAYGMDSVFSSTHVLQKDRRGPEETRVREVIHWMDSRNVSSWCIVDTLDLRMLDNGKSRKTIKVDCRFGLSAKDNRSILHILGVDLDYYT